MSDNPGRRRGSSGRGRGRPSGTSSRRRSVSSSTPAPSSAPVSSVPASATPELSTVPESTTSPDNRCDELKEKIDTIETTFGRLSDEFKNEKAKTTQLETEKRDCDNEKAALQASVNTLQTENEGLES